MNITDEQYQSLMICAKLGHSTTPEVLVSILEDRKTILAAPTPPQPIYDEAKERELFKSVYFRCDLSEDWLSGAFKDKQTRDMWDGWRECAQSRAKTGEVGHE